MIRVRLNVSAKLKLLFITQASEFRIGAKTLSIMTFSITINKMLHPE